MPSDQGKDELPNGGERPTYLVRPTLCSVIFLAHTKHQLSRRCRGRRVSFTPSMETVIVENSNQPLFLELWPDVGQMLGLSRAATYSAAKQGHIPTHKFARFKKVPASWVRKLREDAA